MRDIRFVAQQRGGALSREDHCLMIRWAMYCTGHVLSLFGEAIDSRIAQALSIAGDWEQGKASVGTARQASVAAHALARETDDPVRIAVARSAGHAVATAHMADHSPGAALYALRAVNLSGGSVDDERKWQIEQLPEAIREPILSALETKGKSFKLD